MKSVKLSGGEPTVRNDLAEIIEIFSSASIKPVVITNGIRVKPQHIAALKGAGGAIKFSVHFADRRNDDVLQNTSFDKIVSNIGLSVSAGLDTGVNCVVSLQNLQEMEAMVDFAVNQRCRKISFIPLVFRGSAVENISDSEMNEEIYHQIVSIINKTEKKAVEIRIIDIRKRDYWIIENNGDLIIERDIEGKDTVLLTGKVWRAEQ